MPPVCRRVRFGNVIVKDDKQSMLDYADGIA